MTDGRHLFVYGTLMRAAGGALGAQERERLTREARSLGPATLAAAELYDLGLYPGLVDSAEPGSVVHGEALELADAASTLPWLDDYEGAASGDQSEYARVRRPVHLADGSAIEAWVYVLRRADPHLARISGGRWK